MASQFIEQVQILMQNQQIKSFENVVSNRSNYLWLCNKKTPSIIWMSVRDEFLMRQALSKVTIEQQTQIIKQLLAWLDDYPNVNCSKVPEICLVLLNTMVTSNVMNEVNFSRKTSFRNSLRRLSRISNKVSPIKELPKRAKSVTFNDVPVIYRISK